VKVLQAAVEGGVVPSDGTRDMIVVRKRTGTGREHSGDLLGLQVGMMRLARGGAPRHGPAEQDRASQFTVWAGRVWYRGGQVSAPKDSSQKFDAYARDYQSLHATSVAVSGEDPSYFFEYKRRCVERLVGDGFDEPILDYGCGIGQLMEQLSHRFSKVDGFDPSSDSAAVARQRLPGARFFRDPAEVPRDHYGVIVLSCVLHHVPVDERQSLLQRLLTVLRPGGRLVVFEHNPLNPLTRWAIAHCPFDDDAVLLWPREARRLLQRSGLTDVRRDYIVFLPRALARLRWIEPQLRALPFGAQMMLVGTRPNV
jgi:SAM-dependent methyltransferase